MTSQAIQCPRCQSVLRPKNPVAAGARIRCPKCQEPFVAYAPAPVGSAPPPREDIPAAGPRRSRRQSESERSNNGLLIGLIAGGAVMLLLVIGVVVVLVMNSGSPSTGGNGPIAGGGGDDPEIVLVGPGDPALVKDPRWKRDAELTGLLVGSWRDKYTKGYRFNTDRTYTFDGLEDHAGTYRLVGGKKIEVTYTKKFPPNSPAITQRCIVLVDGDEMYMLSHLAVSEPNHYTLAGPFHRVKDDGTGSNKALEPWLTKLKSPDVADRRTAAIMLDNIGKDAAAAVPELIKALADDDTTVQGGAASCLGKIGAKAKSAVPQLRQVLKRADPNMKRVFITTLGNIGPDASEAIPDLQKCLMEFGLSSETRAALKKIDPKGNW